ncbi:uncharacterized protein LOC115673193 [Syzygium oleosum]|uniref:uncharacterized protein LOC115673193 n=1 Tax=Syzygium oleosum TaxID=219896 RepID=UPI0011D21163|nr:uncharacterized protein LOC115673193 [Syzygium oleosum]
MATTTLPSSSLPSSSLRLSTPSPRTPHAQPKRRLFFPARATGSDTPPPSEAAPAATDPDGGDGGGGDGDDPFESRLSQVRLRYRSGTGKKAEARKVKKSKGGSSPPGRGMYLPPAALREPVSEGLKVEFGFSPYSERMNGRIAALGLAALLLVELATGKSVISYHTPAIVLIQVYSVVAVAALYAKYEKESVSVWPQSPDK